MQATVERKRIGSKTRLGQVFEKSQAAVLSEVISEADECLVKTSDFSELKTIVRDIGEAQKQSEKRLSRLETVMEELAESQKRTDVKMEELAEAQKQSEKRFSSRLETVMEELAESQKRTDV
ncbi:MAG: hypothetical protein QME81_13355, partial [bacterium]|nr:hypothetical protein [bacterium]